MVEQHRVFAHHVEDVVRLAVDGDGAIHDRVEPEERLAAVDPIQLERLLDVRAQTNGPTGPLAHVHAGALAGHDQALVAQDLQRPLDGHPSDPVLL
jgi:hypothetical protein